MKLIRRKVYLDKLFDVVGTPDIKVITGVRRSGKSKLLEAFKTEISQKYKSANIIHINFNIPTESDKFADYRSLFTYVNENYKEGVFNFVLIDEVQMCDGFEKAINGLHAMEKYDIYITGSNAFLLSSDLATLFTGRTFQIKVYPFSFAEYLQYFPNTNVYAALEQYIYDGGMAGSYVYKRQDARYEYLAEVFNTLIVRDIRQKYHIRNANMMDRLTDFLMDNIGNLTSCRSIAETFDSNMEKANHKTIGKYIEYLCNAFAFYPMRRYDVRGKKLLSSTEKFYLSDHAFRYAKLGTKNMDYGRCMENVVAIELLRRGYEVYVGMLYKKEIDFVAVRRNEKVYIQVCDNILDQRTLGREVTPLLAIKDAYPKLILTRIMRNSYLYEGIKIQDIADWLLEI